MLGDFWEMMRSPSVLKFNIYTFVKPVKQQRFNKHLGPCGPCFHLNYPILNGEWNEGKKNIYINFLPQKLSNQISKYHVFPIFLSKILISATLPPPSLLPWRPQRKTIKTLFANGRLHKTDRINHKSCFLGCVYVQSSTNLSINIQLIK